MSKKIELRVHTLGEKCKSSIIFFERCKPTIMGTVAKVPGVKSMSMDSEKGVLTITGTVDVVKVVKELKKANHPAEVISVGPEKPPEKKEEKKEDKKCEAKHECGCKPPTTCKKCETKHECGCKPPTTCNKCEIKHECGCKPPMTCYICEKRRRCICVPPMMCYYCYTPQSSYMPPQPGYPQQVVFLDQPPYGNCTIF